MFDGQPPSWPAAKAGPCRHRTLVSPVRDGRSINSGASGSIFRQVRGLCCDATAELTMHPVYILAFVTFFLLAGFLVWNLISVRRNQKTGGKTSGLGGPNDPLS
jgi:hypothetical protein